LEGGLRMKKKYNLEIVKKSDVTEHHLSVQNDFTLFRYRPINKYTIEALVKNELWVARPDSFNDPYDTSFVVDTKKLIDHLLSKVDYDILQEYKKLRKLKTNSRRKIAESWIREIYSSNLENFKRIFLVGCFSEKIDNEVMWAHYADNATGFAIEYYYNDLKVLRDYHCDLVKAVSKDMVNQFEIFADIFGDIEDQDFSQYNIYKVIYTNHKYDATELLINAVDVSLGAIDNPNFSFLDILKQYKDAGMNLFSTENQKRMSDSIVFTKKKIWEYELEWRMLLPNMLIDVTKINNLHYKIENSIYPKAIYLGEYIDLANKVILYNYCYTNGIILYQMYSKLQRKKYGLSYYEVDKKDMVNFLNKVE
jgi:hypothetical protein